MKKLITIVALQAVAFSGENNIQWDRIEASCNAYLKAFSTEKKIESMRKALKDRIADRVFGSIESEDTAARNIMLDWAVDNRKKLVKKDPELMLQACFYFSIFRERKYLVPMWIREELTPKNVDSLCSYLDGEVAKKQK